MNNTIPLCCHNRIFRQQQRQRNRVMMVFMRTSKGCWYQLLIGV